MNTLTILQKLEIYVPLATIVQFVFYLGWTRVAEAFMQPFGDDDFKINFIIDKNLKVNIYLSHQLYIQPFDIDWIGGRQRCTQSNSHTTT